MNKIPMILRLLLGLVYLVFGLNFFFQFFPLPPASVEGGRLLKAFFESGYMFQLIKTTEIVCGALLLSGFFVPLALILVAPVTLNILCFHLILDNANLPFAIGMAVCHVLLLFFYRASYKPLLKAR